jgi:hypothetical protein
MHYTAFRLICKVSLFFLCIFSFHSKASPCRRQDQGKIARLAPPKKAIVSGINQAEHVRDLHEGSELLTPQAHLGRSSVARSPFPSEDIRTRIHHVDNFVFFQPKS